MGKLNKPKLSSTWKPHINGEIRGISTGDGKVYLAASQVTAVTTVVAAVRWQVSTDCGTLAVLYHSGSVYAGGISRVYGTFTSRGAVKLSSKTGKLDTKFKPVIQKNKRQCTDPKASGTDVYSGANPMSFAWDSVHKQLIEGDGGIVNMLRAINPTTGHQNWKHGMDGDVQAVAVIGNQVAAGHHRSGPRVTHYVRNNGAMLGLYDGKTGQQRVWQPKPDFTGGGNNADGRNNGVIALKYTAGRLYVGGAFTEGGGASGASHKGLRVFAAVK